MDITGNTITCEVCGKVVAPDETFRILTGASCSEGERPHPKTGLTRTVRKLKKYVNLTVCGSEECGSTGIGRIWRGVC